MSPTKFTFILLTAILSFFAPLYTLLLWMFMFVIADLFTGMWAAKKCGILLESHKLRKTVSKTTLYAMAVVLLHAIDTQMLPFASLQLARVATAIICAIELYSIFENSYKITGNRVFWILTQFTSKKIEEVSGVDIEEVNDKA